ncbi:hypothetical protein OIE75_34990 [Streptomyces sp. NBC_01723]|uniref:hypothetical protein n=1 Tax=Streptomyces sp. NBC_01723 TaxID=2975921 RepID=UPI002E2F610E|nr:hypothetical protein [Streptomyces sp. NBC_01723]
MTVADVPVETVRRQVRAGHQGGEQRFVRPCLLVDHHQKLTLVVRVIEIARDEEGSVTVFPALTVSA